MHHQDYARRLASELSARIDRLEPRLDLLARVRQRDAFTAEARELHEQLETLRARLESASLEAEPGVDELCDAWEDIERRWDHAVVELA